MSDKLRFAKTSTNKSLKDETGSLKTPVLDKFSQLKAKLVGFNKRKPAGPNSLIQSHSYCPEYDEAGRGMSTIQEVTKRSSETGEHKFKSLSNLLRNLKLKKSSLNSGLSTSNDEKCIKNISSHSNIKRNFLKNKNQSAVQST